MKLSQIAEEMQKMASDKIVIPGHEIFFIDNDDMYLNVQLTKKSAPFGLMGSSSELNQMEDDLQGAKIIEWDWRKEKLIVDKEDWSDRIAYA